MDNPTNSDLSLQIQTLRENNAKCAQAAHDINNWLSILTGYLSMARQRKTFDELYAIMLIALEKCADQTKAIFLTVRDEDRAPPYERISFSKEYCEAMLRNLRAITDTRIELKCSHCNCLRDESLEVEGNAAQIEQIVFNFVRNAAESMTEEFISLGKGRIRLSYAREYISGQHCYAVISVKDNGSGISKETMATLHERVYTTKGGGHGIGLFQSNRRAVEHRGYLSAESTMGIGSKFSLHLPLAAS